MYTQLNCDEAYQLLSDSDIIIADVRDTESFHEEHIPNAIHLSMTMLQDFCHQSDKTTPILVYCYHGISSQSVAQHLVDQGFEEVYSLSGGYELWKTHRSAAD
ncbi:MAG: thiosulfate sulfurtransferase GlpE [Coxiellaceae bacterium]|nr:thiosulfate sulfurtransferase GlpE [Coxiellaceae bacterium]|tara:strand:- start:7112 stop:7420 length:309 start_codon:yes stop_codon:yes gene_type:complete